MTPIFDRHGRTTAWRDRENIFQLNGIHSAVLHGSNVHGRRGQHLGVFDDGLFRDHRGAVVGFVEGASGGPLLPLTSLPPLAPLPSLPPLPAIPAIPPVPAIPSLAWSSTTWTQFADG